MFENLDYITLQQYWWAINSLLAALFVFMTFVQGGQTLIVHIAKTEVEKSMLYNAVGRKWDLTFTTLVTFGGAMFASFPLFYSTSFGGAYWVWIAILFSFIIQAVSYEYRTKPRNFLGQKTYEVFLFINGIIAPLLVGAAVGTFFTGSEFSVDFARITNIDNPVISRWENATHGLEAALNFTNLSLGLALLFLSRVLAGLYFINSIDNEAIVTKTRKAFKKCSIMFLVFFLTFLALIFTKDGFAVNPETKEVIMEQFKYFNNFLQMPMLLVLFLVGVVLVLYGIFVGAFKKSTKGVWFAGLGTILTVFSLLVSVGFNNTAFYPSTFDLQSSLTIENASSSKYTLVAMSYVSLIVPFVIAYIWYAWRALTKKKIDEADIQNDDLAY